MNYLEKLKTILSKDEYAKVEKDLTVDDKVQSLFINDGKSFVDKATFNAKNEEAKNLTVQVTTLKTTISENTTKLEAATKDAKTIEDYKVKVSDLNKANEDIVKKSDTDKKAADDLATKNLTSATINAGVKLGLFKEGSISEASQKAVMANLDMTKITSNQDGSLSGFNEQLKPIKETSPGLFFGSTEKKEEKKEEVHGTEYIKGNQHKAEGESAEDKIATLYDKKD